MIRRLRIKFVCINMSIVTIMLCVIFGMILHFTGAALEQESLGMLQSVATEARPFGAPGQAGKGVRLPYFSLPLTGEPVSVDGGYYDLTDETLRAELLALSSAQSTGVLKDYSLRYLRVATPKGQLIVFADISSELTTMHTLLKNCILIGVAGFLGFLILSILLARWAVRPVELAWEQQRQFVADASHELKTPLTVILSNAQMLSESGDDPALRRKLTADLVTVAEQMRDLVASLLRSAQTDQGTETMVLAPLDWSETVANALLPFEPVFYERALTLESDIEPELFVQGSPSHLIQVVDILLDNAQKYSADGAHTRLTLRRQGKRHCLLAVANEGHPLSAQEQKDIFKRFYRADSARERSGSYGLGLSIAESIVQAHHGRIWAESCGGVNTFFVRLPSIKKP